MTFTVFDSVKSGGQKDFLGQTVWRLDGIGARAIGKHTLALENMSETFQPKHEETLEPLQFVDNTLQMDKCPCYGATLDIELVKLNTATSCCDLMKHDEEASGFVDRWCVLAAQQIEVYEKKGMSKPMRSIKLQPK